MEKEKYSKKLRRWVCFGWKSNSIEIKGIFDGLIWNVKIMCYRLGYRRAHLVWYFSVVLLLLKKHGEQTKPNFHIYLNGLMRFLVEFSSWTYSQNCYTFRFPSAYPPIFFCSFLFPLYFFFLRIFPSSFFKTGTKCPHLKWHLAECVCSFSSFIEIDFFVQQS